jgi:hypothetical protein
VHYTEHATLCLAWQSPLAEYQEADAAEADAMEIYSAVKPSGRERALPGRLPELTSTLHAHQRRAAAWMVDRETGAAPVSSFRLFIDMHAAWDACSTPRGNLTFFLA